MAAYEPLVDGGDGIDGDLYAFLNVEKNAGSQDINNAYRRLSKLYHPDKHTDPEKKEQADILFNKIKRAYEVLSDPHKRAIYDTVGIKGVETDGWMLIERIKTPQEIRDEYEQLVKEREERRLQQRTNPKGSLIVGVNATDIFDSYGDELSFPGVEISSMSISQSVEAPLNTTDTCSLHGSLSSQNGVGSGSVNCTLRRITSVKGWMEFGFGAGNGLIFTMKGFRHVTSKCFTSLQGGLHFTPMGIVPSLQIVGGQQLTKQAGGYLTWKSGNSLKTTIAWNSIHGHQLTADVQFGIRDNFVSLNYRHKLSDETKLKGSVKCGVAGVFVEYGCEKKVLQNSTLGATVAIGMPSGVTLRVKLSRANQTYLFPILLSEEVLPSAVFYGTIAPVLGWYILKVCVINPYQERQKKKLLEENAAKIAERKKDALIAVNLMRETYERIKEQEESKRGLVIIEAWYGGSEEISALNSGSQGTQGEEKTVIDVTVQLQCLVKDSRLVLAARSKSNLPGFYDPCLGEEKCILIKYSYRNRIHSITVKDEDVIRIPVDR